MPRKTNTLSKRSSSKRKKENKEQSLVFNCTSCAQPQLLIQGKRNILSHPKLQVGVCRECLIFAHSDLIPKDEEGYEIYCEWCCELGNLICCDHCKAPYCEECISRNIGVEYYESLSERDDWKCFACEPSCIEDLRELTKAVLDHQNYAIPSDLLLEKCSAIFSGDPDINDSDREDIVKERIRLRRNNLNETLKKKNQLSKAKKEADEEEEEEEEEEELEDEEDEHEHEEEEEVPREEKPLSEDESSLPNVSLSEASGVEDEAKQGKKENKCTNGRKKIKKYRSSSESDSDAKSKIKEAESSESENEKAPKRPKSNENKSAKKSKRRKNDSSDSDSELLVIAKEKKKLSYRKKEKLKHDSDSF